MKSRGQKMQTERFHRSSFDLPPVVPDESKMSSAVYWSHEYKQPKPVSPKKNKKRIGFQPFKKKPQPKTSSLLDVQIDRSCIEEDDSIFEEANRRQVHDRRNCDSNVANDPGTSTRRNAGACHEKVKRTKPRWRVPSLGMRHSRMSSDQTLPSLIDSVITSADGSVLTKTTYGTNGHTVHSCETPKMSNIQLGNKCWMGNGLPVACSDRRSLFARESGVETDPPRREEYGQSSMRRWLNNYEPCASEKDSLSSPNLHCSLERLINASNLYNRTGSKQSKQVKHGKVASKEENVIHIGDPYGRPSSSPPGSTDISSFLTALDTTSVNRIKSTRDRKQTLVNSKALNLENLTPIQRFRQDMVVPSRCSIPVDVDEAKFLDADRNFRAIHDMGSELLLEGEYEEALEVFEEIVRCQKEQHGDIHPRASTAMLNVGLVLIKMQRYEEAVVICSEAIAIQRKCLSPNHPDLALSLSQQGMAKLECRRYEEALESFLESLQIRRKVYGDSNLKVAKVLNNIGCCFYSLENLSAAHLAYDETLAIQRTSFRQDPKAEVLLSMGSTLSNLASIAVAEMKYEEAMANLEEALLIRQSVLGDDDKLVLATLEAIESVDKVRAKTEEKSMKKKKIHDAVSISSSCVNKCAVGSDMFLVDCKIKQRWCELARRKMRLSFLVNFSHRKERLKSDSSDVKSCSLETTDESSMGQASQSHDDHSHDMYSL